MELGHFGPLNVKRLIRVTCVQVVQLYDLDPAPPGSPTSMQELEVLAAERLTMPNTTRTIVTGLAQRAPLDGFIDHAGAASVEISKLQPSCMYAFAIAASNGAGNATGGVVFAATLPAGLASTQLQFNASFAATLGAAPSQADLRRFADAVTHKLATLGISAHNLTARVIPGSVIVLYSGPADTIGQIEALASSGAVSIEYSGQQLLLVGLGAPSTTATAASHTHPTAATVVSSGGLRVQADMDTR